MTKRRTTLAMGKVALNVSDLSGMKRFYHKIVGLDVLKEDKKMATLGTNDNPLIELHASDYMRPDPTHAGLYHVALLFTSQQALAYRIQQILHFMPRHFSGSADHLVSEAFYVTDPEGNGIELYFDRQASTWQWISGQIQMATQYIDPIVYIEKHLSRDAAENHTRIGHIHLKVGDLVIAREFYVNVLGFDVTAQLPGALFISMDGYHHHIGLNSWESAGAGKRVHSLGLKMFEINFTDEKNIVDVRKRLTDGDVAFREEKNGITLLDPWNNAIHIRYFPAALI